MNDVTVVVLAGGSGSRFWPFVTNKIMFPFMGKGLWEYSISRVLPKETAEVVVVTNSVNNEALKNIPVRVPIHTVIQPQPLGMADALLCAKSHIHSKKLLILIADDLFDSSLPQHILETAEKTGAFGVIPGWNVSSYFPGGYLVLDGQRITGIVEKPELGTEPSNRVNISGHFITDSSLLFTTLEQVTGGADDAYERALSTLMKEREFILHEYNETFTSLKYPWHVLNVMDFLLTNLSAYQGDNCQIKQNVFIEGPVYLGNNVRIFENTKIVGPVYIGDNSIIGNNNVIRHSIIGNNCVTGFNTDITRSYIGDSCWFHGNYIGDSILESNISMGSGSVLANLRLDEGEIYSVVKGERTNTYKTKLGAMIGRNVRIGVNTSLMPGIKVGTGSFIGAGIVVPEDIHDSSFVTGKTTLTIEQNTKQISEDREKYKNKL